MSYWNYYDNDYDWDDSHEITRPDLTVSRNKLQEAGMSEAEAIDFVDSGFVYEELSDSIIDRYYGGPVMSTDMRTRFPLREFCKREWLFKNHVQMRSAKNWSDVRRFADEWKSASPKRLLFRGQTQNYLTQRKINNPSFVVEGMGKVSLIPSLWRRMLKKNPNRFPSFENLTFFEWSHILSSAFDLKDIERRVQALREKGEYIFNEFDMEDSSDPVLQEFGSHSLDLSMGLNVNLSKLLGTLLQHYGLDSPLLDLTTLIGRGHILRHAQVQATANS